MLNRLFRREKLDQGVEKTRAGFFGKIRTLLMAERPIDDDLWDELEALGVVEQQSSRWGESIAAPARAG